MQTFFSTAIHNRAFRRLSAMTAAGVAALVLTASPALAHICIRDFNPNSNGGNSGAWSTREEMLALLPQFGLSPECEQIAEDFITSSPDGRMFMDPGLLAGGTLKNGKGNTPDKVGYLIFELPGECFTEG
jgi:hypothetical protein